MPMGIAIDGPGNVYVADALNRRIQKFASTGTFITKWGAFGAGQNQFVIPIGVAVNAAGQVFVVDMWDSSVQKFVTAQATLHLPLILR